LARFGLLLVLFIHAADLLTEAFGAALLIMALYRFTIV
jgi:hypothetical protein